MKRLLLAALAALIWAGVAGAAVPGGVVNLSVQINIGTDSSNYAVDSVVFRSKHRRANNTRWSWLGKGTKCVINVRAANDSVHTDSLCWDAEIPIDSFKTYNTDFAWIPSVSAWVYKNNGQTLREDIDQAIVLRAIAWADSVRHVYSVDTLLTGVGATATVDYDSIATIISNALTGGGALTCSLLVFDSVTDGLVANARVKVLQTDTTTPYTAYGNTNVNGFFVAALDSATYPIDVAAPHYFQATAYQSVNVTAAGIETLYVYSFAPSSPAGPESCIVIIFTDVPGSSAEFTALTSQTQSTGGVALNPYVEVVPSDANGTISQALPWTSSTLQETQWRITVKNTRGEVMLTHKKYTVPDQDQDTVMVTTR